MKKETYLVPCLFEKLSYKAKRSYDGSINAEEFKEFLRSDLEHLLNAHAPYYFKKLSSSKIENIQYSVFFQGLPAGLSSSLTSEKDYLKYCDYIKNIINIYEPRLKDVNVFVERKISSFLVAISIEAYLDWHPYSTEIFLSGEVECRRYTIKLEY